MLLLAVFLLALALRLAAGFAMGGMYGDGEANRYLAAARSGEWESCAAPFYPLFLRSVQRIFGDMDLRPVRIVQALLGSSVVAALYVTGSAVWSSRVGFVAAIGGAVYPGFVYACASVHPDALLATIVAAMMAVAVAVANPSRRALLHGMLLALGALMQSRAAFFAPGLLLVNRRRAILMVASCAIVIAPWAVRTALERRAPVSRRCVQEGLKNSTFAWYAAERSATRLADRMYVNALMLYSWQPEDAVVRVPGGRERINPAHYVRKYSYLAILLLGTFAAARGLRREHFRFAGPALGCAALLILTTVLNDGAYRVFMEPLLLLYVANVVGYARRRPVQVV
jgi:4-amino-4-deoxy-L-arabinose transferase-like glycosyltransferase